MDLDLEWLWRSMLAVNSHIVFLLCFDDGRKTESFDLVIFNLKFIGSISRLSQQHLQVNLDHTTTWTYNLVLDVCALLNTFEHSKLTAH